VSAVLGRMPSAVGYQPTLANRKGAMQETVITFNKEWFNYFCSAVYVPADELDPTLLPATTFSPTLDAQLLYFSRKITELGIYPV